jgi:hypothetical protein
MLECCVRAAGASTRLLKGRPFLIILLAWGATQLQNIDTATQNTYALHVDLQGLTMGQQTALPFSATQDNETIFNQSINVTPVAMKLKKLMPAIH